jgi:hypothetical protein
MRKFAMAAIAAAFVTSPALAQLEGGVILTNPEFADGFNNRGQCESALAHVRNDQRKNPATRGDGYQDLNGSDFNHASRTTTRCEDIDGRYQVVFYVDGFPAD